jgi:hypothetical protein
MAARKDGNVRMVCQLNRFLLAAVVALVSMGAVVADGEDARGIFLDKSSAGVRFNVTLLRRDGRLTVPSSYEFRSGDKVRKIEVSAD